MQYEGVLGVVWWVVGLVVSLGQMKREGRIQWVVCGEVGSMSEYSRFSAVADLGWVLRWVVGQ